MRFITVLSLNKTSELVEKGKLTDGCIIPMSEELKETLRNYLVENTGFETKPVMGLTRILGKDELKETWDDLSSLLPLKSGDFVLEFEIPNDMVAMMSYEDFMMIQSGKSSMDDGDIMDKLSIEDHVDEENEVAFTSVLMYDHCTAYHYLNDDWEQEDCDLKPPSDLKKTNFFSNLKQGEI